ncbi:MAG: metabolite traffic protein EboE [Planctomycetota bacterium]
MSAHASSTEPELTWCGNVAPARDLDGWLRTITEHYAAVAQADDPGNRPAGHLTPLGVWWPASVAAALASDAPLRSRVHELLAAHELRIATLNAFPFGDFHADVVKTGVYRPSWADASRVDYTLDCARAVAGFAVPGDVIPISTLPLGFEDSRRAAMLDNLRRVARELARLQDATGVRCVLALEPEPDCELERVDRAGAFLCDEVFRAQPDESTLRQHLGVCVDLCHLAVVFEDVDAAFASLRARGVEVGKIQVSSCLELRDGSALDALLAFDEPRYLHQTAADGGRLRAKDLDEVRTRRAEFAAAGLVRTHFHVPVFWDDPGALGSTREQVVRALRAVAAPAPLLEVETYTWSVLGEAWREGIDLPTAIARELRFVREVIAGRNAGCP